MQPEGQPAYPTYVWHGCLASTAAVCQYARTARGAIDREHCLAVRPTVSPELSTGQHGRARRRAYLDALVNRQSVAVRHVRVEEAVQPQRLEGGEVKVPVRTLERVLALHIVEDLRACTSSRAPFNSRCVAGCMLHCCNSPCCISCALERVLALHIVGRHARFAARMCHDMTSEHERTIRAKSFRDAARFCDISARTRAPQALQLPADL